MAHPTYVVVVPVNVKTEASEVSVTVMHHLTPGAQVRLPFVTFTPGALISVTGLGPAGRDNLYSCRFIITDPLDRECRLLASRRCTGVKRSF